MKIAITLILSISLIVGAVLFTQRSGSSNTQSMPTNSVVKDGKQVIEMTAKGGYTPREITAKADMSATIKMNTRGTFDCSSSLVIPSLGYRVTLPPSGTTDIEVPAQKAGTTLKGICAMGMYSFVIKFS